MKGMLNSYHLIIVKALALNGSNWEQISSYYLLAQSQQ